MEESVMIVAAAGGEKGVCAGGPLYLKNTHSVCYNLFILF